MPLMRRLSRSKALQPSAARRPSGEKRTYESSTVRWWEESVQRWVREQLAHAKKKSPLRRAQFTTDSGIPIPDILTPADRKAEPAVALGPPRQFPFTPGLHPDMSPGRLGTTPQFPALA